ncbi:MMS19 nucleotide excision repair protein like protein [Chelonia mydas]|uniref:MMS19 nucleotide excision repair protein n=1 Tax=Chelonia mydas TaxID=8469 RepID=M7BI41_CHEMY|nr:MMS19 nucleotide excision repair protein like protein [Chelonia mydas]
MEAGQSQLTLLRTGKARQTPGNITHPGWILLQVQRGHTKLLTQTGYKARPVRCGVGGHPQGRAEYGLALNALQELGKALAVSDLPSLCLFKASLSLKCNPQCGTSGLCQHSSLTLGDRPPRAALLESPVVPPSAVPLQGSDRSCLENTEPRMRGRGLQLLSQVLLHCHSLLQEEEVTHLVLFCENRLKDHHLVIPAVLQGLHALSMCEVLAPGLAVSVLKAIFQEVHVQSLPQLDRHTVYSIITNFMRTREEELKGLGADFTFGFIQVMDGEKDPRNLLVAFQIVRDLILKDYVLGPFVEELFEVTSCYFPIDFTPFLLPLLIEKMDSEMQSAKLDSLQTLGACCTIYGQKELQEFLPSLWSSLRREVFQTASEKVEAEALAALHSLAACLSRSVLSSDTEDLLDSFLSDILQDCRHHLCEPDMKLVWPSAKLLQAAAGASFRAGHRITSSVVPLLLEQYHQHPQNSQRRTILEMLLGFLELQQKWGHEDEEESALLCSRAPLCSVLFSALTDPSVQLQLVGIQALTVLGTLPGLLAPPDVQLVVDHLTRLILHADDSQSCMAAMEAAGSLAPIYPGAFTGRMAQRLAEELQSEREEEGRQSPHSLRARCLQALAAVSTHPRIVRETVPVLLQCLQQVPKENAHSPLGKLLLEEDVLTAMVPVISAASAHLCPELAAQSVSQVVPLFLDGEVSFLPQDSFPCPFQPFQGGQHMAAQRRLVALLMAFVCSLPRNVPIPQQDRLLQGRPGQQLDQLLETAVNRMEAGLAEGPLRNKSPAGQQLDQLLETAVNRMEAGLAEGPLRTQALALLLWVTKALVLRYHPLSSRLTDKLLGLLGDAELGPAVADGFSLLMADSPDVLHKGCVKANYLKGLSHVLNHLPRPVLVTELPTLLSLLLEALSCPDRVVQLSTLSCLQPLLLEAPHVMSLHVDTLVTKFLGLTSSPAMAIRIAALQCVHALTSLPIPVLLPYKPRVIRALARPLDDLKRLVRKEAVVARGEWFLLGSPGR